MFCLDWSKDLEVYGNELNDEYQRLEIVMVPCNYIHTQFGYEGDSISENCIDNLEKQIEYLGPLDFMIYHNDETFNVNEYNGGSINR